MLEGTSPKTAPTRGEIVQKLAKLHTEGTAVQSYYGRIGCMCGCRGTYSERRATIASRLGNAISLLAQSQDEDIVFTMDEGGITSFDCATTGSSFCFYTKEAHGA